MRGQDLQVVPEQLLSHPVHGVVVVHPEEQEALVREELLGLDAEQQGL